jgi:hypothetical protein
LNYYVYYKVDVARLDEVRATVERLFATVERDSGVRGRWLRRRDDAATYMEVYEEVRDPALFEKVLSLHAKEFPYPRKTEHFQCA